jgi:hypothetical protein
MQGRYEAEALEDLMNYESKRLEKAGRYMLRVKKTDAFTFRICNPEAGNPSLIQLLEE